MAEAHRESTAGAEPFKATLATYWNDRSGNFEREQGIRNALQKQAWLGFLSRAVGKEPKSVLDVGTGPGFLALLLAGLGHRVRGLDLSPGMVAQAQRLAAERGLDAAFDVGDAESLPEPDASYDVLVSRNVLWTLPHPERALADWRRVLKPDGLLVVVDGDWFDKSFSYRLQHHLGHFIVSVVRFRNSWAAERRRRQGYDREFDANLPLKSAGNRQRIPRLVAEAGFADVRLLELPEINRAEKAGMPLAQRLIQPHRFFAVVARRP
jgi:ubiquinone/menaquinone biosynthesis C-methylase UbiE